MKMQADKGRIQQPLSITGWVFPGGLLLLLLLLTLTTTTFGRLKIGNEPLSLSDIGEQQFSLVTEGLYSPMAADSTLLQSAITLKYGINSHLAFTAALPWQQHTFGSDSKMGQGDAQLSLLLHHSRLFSERLHLGWRSSIRLASGYSEEYTGFPSYTSGRLGFENLLLGEYRQHRVKLTAWGGYFSDQAWENQSTIWGAAAAVRLWRDNLSFYTEFGHELNLDDKNSSRQLFTGLKGNLLFGLGWHAGVEQKRVNGKDYPGIFLGLQFTRQPQLLEPQERRRLQPALSDINAHRAAAVRDSAITGQVAPGVRLALLPFSSSCNPELADQLQESCRQLFRLDSNLYLIPAAELQQGLFQLNLDGETMTLEQQQELGLLIGADLLLTGQINRCEQSCRNGAGIPWIYQRQHQHFSLDAEVTLFNPVEGRQLRHIGFRSEREEPLRPHLFSPPDRVVIPLDSPAAADLKREVMDSWAEEALTQLFYLTEIEWTTADE